MEVGKEGKRWVKERKAREKRHVNGKDGKKENKTKSLTVDMSVFLTVWI